MLHKVGGSNTKSNQTLNIIFCVVIKGSWRWLKTNVHRIQPSTKLPQWNFNDKVHHNPKLLDDGGGIPKSQGRGWRLDSRLCNLLSPSHTTCQVVNCLMMMVENYQNLKEEVGCSIPGYEISCLLEYNLVGGELPRDDGGEILKSQGRGWRFDSRLWNLLSTWQITW